MGKQKAKPPSLLKLPGICTLITWPFDAGTFPDVNSGPKLVDPKNRTAEPVLFGIKEGSIGGIIGVPGFDWDLSGGELLLEESMFGFLRGAIREKGSTAELQAAQRSFL